MHGFPYSVRGYDAAVVRLSEAGYYCVVPHLRGYGPTRFLTTPRRARDSKRRSATTFVSCSTVLQVDQAVLCGFDWGGRAACIVAALWSERCAGLVTCGGYNIQDIAASVAPAPAEVEHTLWYQYYFHTDRGRAGLAADRRGIAHLLWRLWSPPWQFDMATFEASAAMLDNPDFVDVVIHSYRHRFGYAAGDPTLEPIEETVGRGAEHRRADHQPRWQRWRIRARRLIAQRALLTSPGRTSSASSAVSATTCRRKHPTHSPTPCWTCRGCEVEAVKFRR